MTSETARAELIAELKRLLRGIDSIDVDADALTEDTRIDAAGFDSLSMLDFLYEIESHYGIAIDVTDVVEMEVVGELVDHVRAKLVR